MNNQPGISEDQLFAYIGRLVTENQILRQQLILLQQQIAQSQQVQANGKEPEKSAKQKEAVKGA